MIMGFAHEYIFQDCEYRISRISMHSAHAIHLEGQLSCSKLHIRLPQKY